MKLFFNIVYYLFVTAILGVVLLILSSMFPIFGDLKIKIVKSGSMEPAIKTGAIVVIKPTTPYLVGDVITFGQDTKTQIPTTHRIVGVGGEGPLKVFTTKGDANDAEDPTPTRLSEVRGKVLFSVPYLGFILDFAKKPIGFALLVGLPALLIIFDEIMKIIREVKSLKRKRQNDISNEREEH